MAVAAGERRIVTVLFADMVGSTSIAEQLGAERSKFLVDEVMRLMGEQVTRFGGTVAQLVGDELFAVFGVPIANEDDAERAVQAALAIQRAVATYAGEVREAYGIELAVRISINTGPVVIRMDSDDPYNALGDTVNVASRLQELAAANDVVIGPGTKAILDDCFTLEQLGEHELAGRAELVEVFKIVGVVPHQAGADLPPLLGREFELVVLERLMDALLEGRGAIVSVLGEAGIGKTRLVAEVLSTYRGRARSLTGRAVSYAHSFPYWPVRELLREWLGASVSAPEARVRLDLRAELAGVLREDAADAFPFLASLLDLTLEPEAAQRVGELSRESLQYETIRSVSDLVSALAEEEPLCLVFEDLHWADESTIELIEELLPLTEQAALVLFLVSRGDRDHKSWSLGERARQRFPHRYRELELGPLAPDASRLLAEQRAEGSLPPFVTELLLERAGGNPFFLEEALRDLQERGALRREGGLWVLAVDRNQLTIPALVEGTLQARIDRLDASTREVLSLAATIGKTFGMQLLEQLVAHDQLTAALSDLQRLDLIVEQRRRPQLEYGFRHGLVQEVVYTRLIESKRRKLHGRVGIALEAISGDAGEAPYSLLAHHFGEADDAEKAVQYLLRAGDAARALYADREAIEHYRRARASLSRLDDDERARETLFKIALTHHLAFDFAAAEDTYDEAFCCKPPPRRMSERTARIETAITPTLDQLRPGDAYTVEALSVLQHLFRGLVMVDADTNVVPAAADNFRVSGDGTTYLFRLREGMSWSDGEPVTAEDFVYGWQHARQERPWSFLLEDVAHTRAVDDWTLEVSLETPRNYFLYILACGWLFPWPRHAVEALGEAWRDPEHLVTNGPFALTDYSAQHVLLTANEHWTGAHGNVGEIHIALGVPDEERHNGWREGRYDVLEAHDPSLADCPNTRREFLPGYGTHYLGFKTTAAPFSSRLARLALSAALDRGALLPDTMLARPARRGGLLPPAIPGHAQRVLPEPDLELARRLLADAGYPGGAWLPTLNLSVPDSFGETGSLVEQWAQLGLQINTIIEPARSLRRAPDDAHIWLRGFVADYPDPDGFFRGLLRQPTDLLETEDLHELLEEARALRDPSERIRRYQELDKLLLVDRAVVLPIAYKRSMILRRPWVEQMRTHPMVGIALDEAVVRGRPETQPAPADGRKKSDALIRN